LIWELGPGKLVVLEAKYTWTPSAHTQLEQLYRPVVEAAMGGKMAGVVVCKNLVPEMPRSIHVTGNLANALVLAASGVPCVVQWIGGVGLGPLSRAFHPAPAPALSADALGL